jgi:hypothetical protein
MLGAELSGAGYSKADHGRDLRAQLGDRSEGSVEFKHQNISAALVEMGLPYIEGYKPARNYQKAALPQAIGAYLARHPGFLDAAAAGPVLSPVAAPAADDRPVDALFEDPPGRIVVSPGEEKP